MTDREDKIRERAYSIWEQEGHPHGRHQDHWHRAVAEVEGVAPAKPAKKAAPKRRKAPSAAPAPAAKAEPAPKAKSRATTTRKRTPKKS